MIYYQCHQCKEKSESQAIDLPDGMEMKKEKLNNYIFVCSKCLLKG
jgi:hypothetical protein